MKFQFDDQAFSLQIKVHGNQPHIIFEEQPSLHLFDFFEWLMNAEYSNAFKYALTDFLGQQMIQIKEEITDPDGTDLMKIGNDVILILIKDGIKYYKLNDIAKACGLTNITTRKIDMVTADGIKYKLPSMTAEGWFVTRQGLRHLFERTRTDHAHSVLETFFYRANYAIPYHALEMYKLMIPQQTGLRKELFHFWKSWLSNT